MLKQILACMVMWLLFTTPIVACVIIASNEQPIEQKTEK